jgi:anti-sigma regulatory factor (Ser/Thr protein kinase)
MPARAGRASDQIADPVLLTYWAVVGRLTLPGRPEHVRDARGFVARLMDHHRTDADIALLLTSEVVTNAITHSRSGLPGGQLELVVAWRHASLLFSVIDQGSDTGLPKAGNAQGGESGNGLLLVDRLADDWGYATRPGGTAVWFRLALREVRLDG